MKQKKRGKSMVLLKEERRESPKTERKILKLVINT